MWKCNIEKIINKSGLRKDFIADKIGTTTRQLRKYEKFELFIPMEKGLLLSELLECKVDDLYTREEDYISSKEEFLQTGIENLKLSTRVYHKLKHNDIYSYDDLLNKEIIKRSGLGEKSLEELNTAIKQVKKELAEIEKAPLK